MWKNYLSKISWAGNFLVSLLFLVGLLVPLFFVNAGSWQQSTQSDFSQGTVNNSDLQIASDQIKPAAGSVYEDAEDGDTAGWSAHSSTPAGTTTNVSDQIAGSRVINFSGNGSPALFIYKKNHKGPYTLAVKIKAQDDFLLRVSAYTSVGYHSYLHYEFGQDGQITPYNGWNKIELADSRDANGWLTFERDLEKDLQQAEPGNKITRVGAILVKNVDSLDYANFLADEAVYTSPVLDLGTDKVDLGKIAWDIDQPAGTSIEIRTRTSSDNSTWSNWSSVYSGSPTAILSANQRYIQYKATFDSDIPASVPALNQVSLDFNRSPSQPNITGPGDNFSVKTNDKLLWQSAADLDSGDSVTYTVELDDDSNFKSIDSSTSSIKTSEIQIAGLDNLANLQEGVSYNWRVKAVDNNNAQSDYSASRALTIDKENLAPIAPQSGFNPYQSGIVKILRPTIYWDAGSDPNPSDSSNSLSYVVQVDDSNKFNSANLYATKAGETNFTFSKDLNDNAQYYYRVRSVDDEGLKGSWSATQTFVVVTGKTPDVRVAKTVKINEDDDDSAFVPYLFGSISRYFNNNGVGMYYVLALLVLLSLSILLLRRIQPVRVLSSCELAHKTQSTSEPNSNLLFAKLDVDAAGGDHDKKTGISTKIKSRVGTAVAILVIGALAAAAGVIRYYQENPSPYKDDGQEVSIGDELTYRIDYANKGETKATNFNIVDSIPTGTSYVDGSAIFNDVAQTDTSDNDVTKYDDNSLKFNLGDLTAGTSGYVTFKAKITGKPEDSKVKNAASVVYGESSGVLTSNEVSNQVVDKTTSKISGEIKGIVWHDASGDATIDDGEEKIADAKIKVYNDADSNGSLDVGSDQLAKEAITNATGQYSINNLEVGSYFVQVDESTLPSDKSQVITINPQLVKLRTSGGYTGINFAVGSSDDVLVESNVASGKIVGSVWNDVDQDGDLDNTETGMVNVSLKLFEDSDDNQALDENTDLYVTTSLTDANGEYEFTGLAAKKYLVKVSSTLVGYELTSGNSTVPVELISDGQVEVGVSFGYYLDENDTGVIDGVKVLPTITTGYGGDPKVVSTADTVDEDNTLVITPLEIGEGVDQGGVMLPTLTHIGSAQIDNYQQKYSLGLEDELSMRGKTGPGYKINLFIHSDINLKVTTTADQDGIWETSVNPQLFEPGEHRIFAQSQDLQGNLSKKVEVARFVVNKKTSGKSILSTSDNTIYWIALLALLIIAATIVAVTWIKEGDKKAEKKSKRKIRKKKK